MVTICTASLTFNNSTFCPHSVFTCFVWISEQTAIISLCNINWLVLYNPDAVCLLRGTDWTCNCISYLCKRLTVFNVFTVYCFSILQYVHYTFIPRSKPTANTRAWCANSVPFPALWPHLDLRTLHRLRTASNELLQFSHVCRDFKKYGKITLVLK